MARQQDLISSYIRTRRATDRGTNPLSAIFNTVAQAVIDHRAEGFKNLETLKTNRESITSGIDQRITKISPLLNPVINEALTGFKEQYDKGAKMNSLALTPKKRQEGKDMMKIAMDKMMALSGDLDVLKLQRERARNMSNIMNGESGDGTTKGMNPGANSEEFRNTTMLGNDELLKSMTIDKDSGRLMVVNRIQNPGDPSEGGYAKDPRDYGAPGGLITTDPSDDPKSGASPGNLRYYTPEEIKEMQKNNTLPEDLQYANAQDYQQNVLLKDLKFAQEEDPGMEITQRGFVKQAIQRGEAGKSFDPQYYQSEIWGAVKDAPENAFKTYFFGGNTYDFSSGKMPESSPAYNYLRQTMPNVEPGSKEWEVAMEQLKFQNFGRNSDLRKIVAANMFDVAKAKYDDYKAIYDQNQENKKREAIERSSMGRGGTTWNTSYGAINKVRAQGYVNQILNKDKDVQDLQGFNWVLSNKGLYETFDGDGNVLETRTPADMIRLNQMESYYPGAYKEAMKYYKTKENTSQQGTFQGFKPIFDNTPKKDPNFRIYQPPQ